MLIATTPGASLAFRFQGSTIGVLAPAGPDAGQIEFSVDGRPYQTVDLFTRWSRGLHLPWSYVLASGLEAGDHLLRLRVAATRHDSSRGNAVRIAYFLTNPQ